MQKIEPRSSVASKSFMSEANSDFCSCLCFFSKSQQNDQKIAPRIERKRDSIEFERSENQGQFFIPNAFNYF
jgi:hypothetical protein